MTADEILEALLDLPVALWTYEWEPPEVRHLGPMAQDFAAAFGLGDKDTVINTVDACGVLMVAVKVLARRVATLEAQCQSTP